MDGVGVIVGIIVGIVGVVVTTNATAIEGNRV